MKYAVYIISAIIGGILTAGVFPQASLWGLEPDLLLVFAVCCVMISHSPAPVIFTGITAFFVDMFYMGSVEQRDIQGEDFRHTAENRERV